MIYTYRCRKCNKTFELERTQQLIQELGFSSNPRCPRCLSANVVKTITSPNISFKGKDFTKSVKEE